MTNPSSQQKISKASVPVKISVTTFKENIDYSFENLQILHFKQHLFAGQVDTYKKPVIYVLRKLKETRKLKEFLFWCTLASDNVLSETIRKVSFGYMMYLSRLVTLDIYFDDLLSHHICAIWRTVEQNSITIKIVDVSVNNENISFMPIFRTQTKINLKKFKINKIRTRDIWLFSRHGNNITSKEIVLIRVNQMKTWKTEMKCFLDNVSRQSISYIMFMSESLTKNSEFIQLRKFVESL